MKHTLQKLQIFMLGLLLIGMNVNAIGPRRKTATRKVVAKETPAMQVGKEMTTLDQIVEQARIIVKATEPVAQKTRSTAKNKIVVLMKDLEPQNADAISNDIEIIKATGRTPESKEKAQKAVD